MMTWGSSTWGVAKWGEPVFLTAISPPQISTLGGEAMVATGTFSITTPVVVHLGPLGTTADSLCYGGQGLGYEVLSLDGTTLEFSAPPLPKGPVILTVVGPGTGSIAGVTVIERNWPGKLHQLRKNFAPWAALGGRRLDLEPIQ